MIASFPDPDAVPGKCVDPPVQASAPEGGLWHLTDFKAYPL